MRERARTWVKTLAGVLVGATLPACTVALHGHQSSSGGMSTTATSSSVSVGTSGGNYAVRASFGHPVPPGAPGGYLSVSSGSAAAALFLGIVVINALEHASGRPGGGTWTGTTANRPIAHTCSCYGYRPDEDPQQARE
jgi:hypothetical protein